MDWNIRGRSETCRITGKPFVEDELFYTLLFEVKEEIERKDVCTEAWDGLPESERGVSHWKSVFKPAPPAQEEAVRKEDAESELRNLLESKNPLDSKVCFFLALLLERKRVLKRREIREVQGQRVIVYEHTATQDTFLVPDPGFKISDAPLIQEELQLSGNRLFARKDLLESTAAAGEDGTPEQQTAA
jgi:hypothetical protein